MSTSISLHANPTHPILPPQRRIAVRDRQLIQAHARIVDQHVRDRALPEHCEDRADALLGRDVRDDRSDGAGRDGAGDGGRGLVERGAVAARDVDGAGAGARELVGHGAPDALAAAGDEDRLVRGGAAQVLLRADEGVHVVHRALDLGHFRGGNGWSERRGAEELIDV